MFSNHCERPGRVLAIWKGLKTRKLDQRCTMIPSRLATKEEILLVHSEKFYDDLERTKTLSRLDLKKLDGSLRSVEYNNVRELSFFLPKHCSRAQQEVFDNALMAAGSCLNMVDAIMNDQVRDR